MKIAVITSAFIILMGFTLKGQDRSTRYDLYNLLENEKLELFNRTVSKFSDGQVRGIRFSKNQNDGIAWLNGVELSNGVIEVDIRGKDAFQESFVGVAFHGVNNEILDAVYFRPFNFRSTDPVRKIHAVQYISHPDFPWPVLREKFNGKYEKEVNPAPDGNEFFHAKIVVEYPKISVYVNESSQPSLVVEKLNDRKTGKVGLWVGNNSDGDFANLQITNR